MGRKLARWGRIAGTGFSFTVFGIGSLLIGLVAFPTLAIVHRRDAEARELAVQRVIHRTFRLFEALMASLRLIRDTIVP